MDILDQWAREWGIRAEAVTALRSTIISRTPCAKMSANGGESSVQLAVRYEATKKGMRLWRNNVGFAMGGKGNVVRFGLANDSKRVNDYMKSHDLIGIRPELITPAHVGTTIGRFVSREVKRPGWKFTGTPREVAQLRWAELIIAMGGDACFVTGEGTL